MTDARPLIVWDWNGTLIDDLQANVDCVNVIMAHFGKPSVDVAHYQEAFEVPILKMYLRMNFTAEEHAAHAHLLQAMFHENYEQRVQTVGFRHGARDLIESTRAQGVRHVILSNHLVTSISDHLDRLDAAPLFDGVLAHADVVAQRSWHPKGERLRDYMAEHGVAARDCLIVGDTPEEVEIARQLNLTSVAIRGGFASDARLAAVAPDYTIACYSEFPDLQRREVA